jgi:hypothetical protein
LAITLPLWTRALLLEESEPEPIQRPTAVPRQTRRFRLAAAAPLSPELARDVCRSLVELFGGLAEIHPVGSAVQGPSPNVGLSAPRCLETAALSPGTILLVRNRLDARLLATVRGWAKPRRGVAIVSASGLEDSPARIAALVGHEAAHLLGLRHCRSPHCLARQASDLDELDWVRGFCRACATRIAGQLPSATYRRR